MRGCQATRLCRHLQFTDETDVFVPKYHILIGLIGCVAFDVNNNNIGSVFYL